MTDAAAEDTPRVSVVVRSFHRLGALAELLDALVVQQHASFEVVVVEQSGEWPDDHALALARHVADTRVRFLRVPPLGGPGARNHGVRAARGAIVILIDDDDLPLGRDWVTRHEAHFIADPKLVGESARQVRRAGERSPYALRALTRALVMRYSPLETPLTFARFDEDVAPVGWLHGTNSAVRREVALAAGLWDEHVKNQDEHSFAFKLRRVLAPGQYLAFKAQPMALRRMDIEGGMGKRFTSPERELRQHIRFQHQVIGRYFPELYRRARVLYHLHALGRTALWLAQDARAADTWRERVAGLVDVIKRYPAISAEERGER